MAIGRSAVYLLLGLALAGCAAGQSGRANRLSVDQSYSRAQGLREAGRCAEAVDLYYPLAMRGQGFERSQLGLGQCLLELDGGDVAAITATAKAKESEKNPPPSAWAKIAASGPLAEQGIAWLNRAADAGEPNAQASLAEAYLFGNEPLRNRAKAAYWWVLYGRNRLKAQLGFAPLPAGRLAKVAAAFTPAELATAGQAADPWQPRYWTPPKREEVREPPEEEEEAPPPYSPRRRR